MVCRTQRLAFDAETESTIRSLTELFRFAKSRGAGPSHPQAPRSLLAPLEASIAVLGGHDDEVREVTSLVILSCECIVRPWMCLYV